MQRDLRDIASAQKLVEMPTLLRLLAISSAKLLDYRKLARDLQLSDKTVSAYVGLLRTVFLLHVVPAWRPGLRSRELHTPKVYFTDTGLLAQQLGVNEQRIAEDDQVTGYALETFCGMEILKHQSWAAQQSTLRHYRVHDDEIDIVLEAQSCELAAVEVKARASIRESDWRVMRKLRDERSTVFKAVWCSMPADKRFPSATAFGLSRSAGCGSDWSDRIPAISGGTRAFPRGAWGATFAIFANRARSNSSLPGRQGLTDVGRTSR